MKTQNEKGFTYPEVVMTLPIVLLSVLTAMATLLASMQFNEDAQLRTRAINLAAYRLEQIRSLAVADRTTLVGISVYNNTRYPTLVPTAAEIQTMNRLGIEPTSAEAITRVSFLGVDLYQVQVTVCYRTRGGRVIGEDKNLNGTLNTGEDVSPANGEIDSPIRLITYIARK